MIGAVASADGLLVMADISGYTAFVSGTEHDHSREILAELIENIAKSFGGKLSVDQVEGDALCCTTERTGVEVTDWLRETFGAFHRRLRDMRAATTCSSSSPAPWPSESLMALKSSRSMYMTPTPWPLRRSDPS